MSRRHRVAGVVLLAWLAASAVHAGAPSMPRASDPSGVHFAFAPPDGTHWIETLHTRRVKRIGGRTQREEGTQRTLVSLRRSAQGYTLQATPISVTLERDGRPAPDPLVSALAEVTVTAHVGADGRVRRIDGYADFVDRMRRSLPPRVVRAMAPLLNEQTLAARDAAEWDGRVAMLAGRMLEPGATLTGTLPYVLPSGESIDYRTRVTLGGREACAPGSCVRIETVYDSDAQPAARMAADAVGAGAAGRSAQARISGTGSRLVDPATLLVYAETVSRTIHLTLDVPGRGAVPMVLEEERRTTFDYR